MKDFFKRTRFFRRTLSCFLSALLILYLWPIAATGETATLNANEEADSTEYAVQDIPAVELLGLREENVKHFRLADGSYIAAVYDSAVHYRDGDGAWQDIDNTLVLSDGRYAVTAAGHSLSFAARSGSAELFSMSDGEHTLSFGLADKVNSVRATVENPTAAVEENGYAALSTLEKLSSTIRYDDIAPGVSLEYRLVGGQIYENIIVENQAAPTSYSFHLTLDGLSIAESADGALSLRDKQSGEEIFSLPASYMTDSTLGSLNADAEATLVTGGASRNEPGFSSAVAYEITSLGKQDGADRYLLTISADGDWLQAEERNYPVTIDPPVVASEYNLVDVTVNSRQPSQAFGGATTISVGEYNGPAFYSESYTYVRALSLPSLPGGAIVNDVYLWACVAPGTFSMEGSTADSFRVAAYMALGSANAATTWNSKPAVSDRLVDYATVSAETQYINMNITAAYEAWIGGEANHGLCLKLYDRPADGETHSVSFYAIEHAQSGKRPRIEFYYLMATGLEGRYSYTPVSTVLGTAYIGDATGALTLLGGTVSAENALWNYSPTMIYRSQKADSAYVTERNTGAGVLSSVLGNGWMMDFQESMRKETLNGSTCFVWLDSDGTEHYLKSAGDGRYEDEEGLGIVLTESNGQFYVKFKDGSYHIFAPEDGKLLQRSDGKGNSLLFDYGTARTLYISLRFGGEDGETVLLYTVNYSANGSLASIVTASRGDYVNFGYVTSNGKKMLSDVTQRSGFYFDEYGLGMADSLISDVYLGYDSEGRLCEVCDRMTSPYRATLFDYNEQGKVVSVSDGLMDASGFGYSPAALLVSISYNGKETVYRLRGADETYNTADDLLTVCVLDNYGRTVRAYTTDLERNTLYGSDETVYGEGEGGMAESAVQTAAMPYNLLKNGTFEQGTQNWQNSVIGLYDALGARMRSKHLLLSLNDTDTASALSAHQAVTLSAGKYTFSVYLDPSELGGGTAILWVTDPTGAVLDASEAATASYAAFASADGYRLTLPFTALADGNYTVFIGLSRTGGDTAVLKADNASLSVGMGAGSYDYMQNGRFAYADGAWSGAGARISGAGLTGDGAWRIVGDIDESYTAMQTVFSYDETAATILPDDEAHTFLLTGWAKANALREHEDARFELQAYVLYQNTRTGELLSSAYIGEFNPAVTGWQQVSVPIRLTAERAGVEKEDFVAEEYAIRTLFVKILYSHQAGDAYFDNISLVYDNTRTTEYAYEDGNITSITLPDGKTVSYVYEDENAPDQPSSITAVDGSSYQFTYDEKQQITRVIYESASGNTKTTTDYTYDALGNVIATETAAHGMDAVLYSSAEYATDGRNVGALLSATDYLGNTTRYITDQNSGRVLAEIYPDGSGIAYTYDYAGRLHGLHPITNYNAQTGAYDYNWYGAVEYVYTEEGYLAAILIPRDDVGFSGGTRVRYSFTYDDFGNRTAVLLNGETLATYAYSSSHGKLITTTYAGGFSIHYEYDALDRLSGISYNNGGTVSYSYTYDAEGRLATHTDAVQGLVYTYDYDIKGRPTDVLVRKTNGTPVYRLHYEYDGKDLTVKTSYTVYTVTDSGDIETATLTFLPVYNADGVVTSYKYQRDGNTFARISYDYDAFGRLTTRTAKDDALTLSKHYTFTEREVNGKLYASTQIKAYTAAITYDSVPKTLYTWKYTYDANGNIIMVEEYRNGSLLHTISYEYDRLGQLVFEEKLQGTAFDRYYYEYDEIGNLLTCGYECGDYADFGLSPRTNQHFFYGAYTPAHWDRLGHQMEGWCQGTGDEYTFSSPTNTITYDALYNPLTYSNPAGKSFTFTWSGRRLTGVNGNVSYTYNEDGIRTSKTVDGITYTYILNGSTILAELWTKNGKNCAIYYTYDETGLPFSMEYTNGEESAILYYITNPMGDVVALCAENGNIVASYTYSAWGSQTEHYSYSSTSIQRKAASCNPFRYRSYYYDIETGFYYCNSRYYDPSVYRWINADTAEALLVSEFDVAEKNLFVYCKNNPVMYSDNGGELANIVVGAVVGFAFSFVVSAASDWISYGSFEKINWNKALVSGAIGAVSGAAIAAFPAAAVAISAVSGALDSAASDLMDNYDDNPDNDVTVSDMIINATTSAALSAVSGSWGDSFSNASLYDDGIEAFFNKGRKGINPTVKKAAKKVYKKFVRQLKKDILEYCAEGVCITLLQKGTAFSVSKGIAYWKDLN